MAAVVPIRAYRNLNIRSHVAYSLQSQKTRKVVGHLPEVYLTDAKLVVSEAGRQRVLKEQRKNVHAFAVGNLEPYASRPTKGWVKIRYNPYLFDSFVLASDQTPIKSAKAVSLDAEGAWALEPVIERRKNGPRKRAVADEIDLWNG